MSGAWPRVPPRTEGLFVLTISEAHCPHRPDYLWFLLPASGPLKSGYSLNLSLSPKHANTFCSYCCPELESPILEVLVIQCHKSANSRIQNIGKNKGNTDPLSWGWGEVLLSPSSMFFLPSEFMETWVRRFPLGPGIVFPAAFWATTCCTALQGWEFQRTLPTTVQTPHSLEVTTLIAIPGIVRNTSHGLG